MKNVAIIGAGQLGFRHLQGLCRSKNIANIWIIDPNQNNLDRCAKEFSVAGGKHRMQCLVDVEQLPEQLDLAIISTTADVRFSVLQRLVKSAKVNAIIFEKVLFQSEWQCNEAADILKEIDTQCWVNCANREFKHMQRIRDYLSEDTMLQFDVCGGNWGLACNAIHYLDLIKYISNEQGLLTIEINLLDKGWIASKRQKFHELTGRLVGKFGKVNFSLDSHDDGDLSSIMTIRGKQKACIVDFKNELMMLHDSMSKTWITEYFHTPYQSEMTGDLFDRLCEGGVIHLPSFSESIEIHIPMLKAFLSHFINSGSESNVCPIT